MKDAFYEVGYDTGAFDEIEVPGVWQMAGYDTHQYTNIRYPFPFDPPYVPQDIPCGAYVHTFSYAKDVDAAKAFLNFEGVDSCFYVWINGAYVGYSQVSHMTSEFDVTDILKEGENTIADYIAVRTIEIKDKFIYFNGQKIKFRGVNRHDSDPVTGFKVDVEKIKKDLTLMKQHNFNAIRSGHYPNAPYFYQMCDKYGFLVCDEADIEAHGSYNVISQSGY